MPDLNLDDSYDAQDEAETFDETHRTDELSVGADDLQDEPDLEDDVYDVTSAQGDADEDDDDAVADDYGPDDLDELDPEDEEDEDEDEDLDDDFEDEPDEDDLDDDLDDEVDASAARSAPSEPSLAYSDNLDALTNPRDDDVEKYESTRELSNAQLADLGYRDAPASPAGSGASAEDVPDEADAAESDRLDEGLEETFPASDPVSAKHIT